MEADVDGPLLRPRSTSFDTDVAHELGSYVCSDIPINSNERISTEYQQKQWALNYHEAAIYVQEGENNDKFNTHPKNQGALPAYLLAHNIWFYLLDLVAALLLLSLAAVERPAVPGLHASIWVHASLELLALTVISLELAMKLKWLGVKTFFRHVRTAIKAGCLFMMIVEAIVVLIRQTSHFRVTRALRPIFVLDSYFCRGVRRFVRQIIQSLPPIMDMLLLLLFFMLIFSILGFYIFSNNPDDPNFSSFEKSFISLFILLTTANFPDVMMPAYAKTRWAALFFVVYLSVELYFLMNLLLAVVYDAFLRIEKLKLKKLMLHKRTACQYAFKLLVSKQKPDKIQFQHFMGFLKKYRPKLKLRDMYLIFKSMDSSQSGELSEEDFLQVYHGCALSWKIRQPGMLWSSDMCYPCNKLFLGLNWFVRWKWFSYFIYLTITVNFMVIIIDTILISVGTKEVFDVHSAWHSIVFVSIYIIEVILKLLGLGIRKYFSDAWNVFDFVVTVAAVVGILGELYARGFYYIVILRPIRLLRLLKMKRRFRDVIGTLGILLSRLFSLAIALVLLYYFFAIIGMELYSHFDMKNCCKNTSVEIYYAYDNGTGYKGYYYLNTFENIIISSVTLFELTVVNNWYIIMEGYAAVSSNWSRIYFMIFYIITMVVMTVVVAFILEAFLFRMQYTREMHCDDFDDQALVKVDITLTREEVNLCQLGRLNSLCALVQAEPNPTSGNLVTFRGKRIRNKEDFSLQMYIDEVKSWIDEETNRRVQIAEELHDRHVAVRPRNDRTHDYYHGNQAI